MFPEFSNTISWLMDLAVCCSTLRMPKIDNASEQKKQAFTLPEKNLKYPTHWNLTEQIFKRQKCTKIPWIFLLHVAHSQACCRFIRYNITVIFRLPCHWMYSWSNLCLILSLGIFPIGGLLVYAICMANTHPTNGAVLFFSSGSNGNTDLHVIYSDMMCYICA